MNLQKQNKKERKKFHLTEWQIKFCFFKFFICLKRENEDKALKRLKIEKLWFFLQVGLIKKKHQEKKKVEKKKKADENKEIKKQMN